jgi:hypothetical protein
MPKLLCRYSGINLNYSELLWIAWITVNHAELLRIYWIFYFVFSTRLLIFQLGYVEVMFFCSTFKKILFFCWVFIFLLGYIAFSTWFFWGYVFNIFEDIFLTFKLFWITMNYTELLRIGGTTLNHCEWIWSSVNWWT